MRLYLLQHRKRKHHHKLATKENNESELVSVGVSGGRSIWQNLIQNTRCLGRGIKYFARYFAASGNGQWPPLVNSTAHAQLPHKPTQQKQGQKFSTASGEQTAKKAAALWPTGENETSDFSWETALWHSTISRAFFWLWWEMVGFPPSCTPNAAIKAAWSLLDSKVTDNDPFEHWVELQLHY